MKPIDDPLARGLSADLAVEERLEGRQTLLDHAPELADGRHDPRDGIDRGGRGRSGLLWLRERGSRLLEAWRRPRLRRLRASFGYRPLSRILRGKRPRRFGWFIVGLFSRAHRRVAPCACSSRPARATATDRPARVLVFASPQVTQKRQRKSRV